MLGWALTFLVVALIAAFLGFGGIAGASAGIVPARTRSHKLPLAARKRWLAGQLQVCGSLTLDAGAVNVLRSQGSSLLPVGVKQVQGIRNVLLLSGLLSLDTAGTFRRTQTIRSD